jgi:MraZ protein
MFFLGEYEYKVDAKGRVPIPPKFRKHFTDGIVLNMGAEECINAYPLSVWEEIAKEFDSGPIAPSRVRQMNRAVFASAFDTELDDQGRVMLPPPLRQHADIKDILIIAGTNKYLEIWSKESWERQKALWRDEAWNLYENQETRQ